jgi:hypothetical protein
MHNQHAGLSQVLAEQHISQRREQAAQARLIRGARRRRAWAVRGWWPGGQPSPQTSPSAARKPAVDRSEVTMSRRARTLILGVALAAMTLAGLTAVAQAQPTAAATQTTGSQDQADQRKAVYQLDRSLAQHHAFGAVGASAAQAVYQLDRSLARHHAQGATAAQPAARTDPAADHAVASQQQNPTDAQELFRRGERASLEQPTRDSVKRAAEAQERYYSTWGYGDTPAPAPDEPSGQPDWLVPAIGVLAAVLALVAGMAVLAARRANRRVRAGQAA